jgi:hypothetical protein
MAGLDEYEHDQQVVYQAKNGRQVKRPAHA